MYMHNHRVHKAWARQRLYFFIHIPTGIYRCFVFLTEVQVCETLKSQSTKRQDKRLFYILCMHPSHPASAGAATAAGKDTAAKVRQIFGKVNVFPRFVRKILHTGRRAFPSIRHGLISFLTIHTFPDAHINFLVCPSILSHVLTEVINYAVVYTNCAVVCINRAVVFTNRVAVYSLCADAREFLPASWNVGKGRCGSLPPHLLPKFQASLIALPSTFTIFAPD